MAARSVVDATAWTEKYRPQTLDDVVGNPSAVRELRAWAKSWGEGKPSKPGVVLVGEAGIGKTTAALALAREMDWTPIELNASDARNKDVIERVVTRGALAQGFTATGEYQRDSEGARKLLILDEADNVFGREDRGGMQQIVETLRETRQPIILIANDAYALSRKAGALKGLTHEIKFQRAQAGTVAKVLAGICRAEGIETDVQAVEALAEHAGGDIRAAVTDLEALAAYDRKLTLADVEALGYRDARATIFDALQRILRAGSFGEAKGAARDLDEDPETLLLWVEENVPREYTDPEDRARAMAVVARADEFIAATRRRQYYRFWAVASDLMTGGVAMAKTRRYTGWTRYQFPSWLRKLSTSRAQRALRDGLGGKVGGALHSGTRTAREHLVPLLSFVMERDEDFAVHVAGELELTADELALLLGDKSSSARVKRILKAAEPPPDTTTRVRPRKAEAGEKPARSRKRGKGSKAITEGDGAPVDEDDDEATTPGDEEPDEDAAEDGGAGTGAATVEKRPQKNLFEF